MLTAAIDNTVRVWSVTAGSQLFALEGTGFNAAVALSGDGKLILTGGELESAPGDASAKLWSAKLWDARHRESGPQADRVGRRGDGRGHLAG